jgi:chemotaxis protein CheD
MTSPGSSPTESAPAAPISVPIGGLAAARSPGILRTFLGSCVGLALYDRRLLIGGLAHVVLPDSSGNGSPPGKYADTAVPALVAELQSLAVGRPLRLTARLVGGAKMFAFQSGPAVGDLNVDALEKLLRQADIPVMARAVGGSKGRRMTLDVTSGQITIESVGDPPSFL